MKCKECGYEVNEGEACPKCGASLDNTPMEESDVWVRDDEEESISESDTIPEDEDYEEEFAVDEESADVVEDDQPTKKNSKVITGVISAALLVCIACVVLVFALKDKNKEEDVVIRDKTEEQIEAEKIMDRYKEIEVVEDNDKNIDYSKYIELGQYKDIDVYYTDITVTDDDVEARIHAQLQQFTRRVEVKDRDVLQKDDIADIDYTGYLDGEEFEGGSGERYKLKLGSGQFIPGFEDQLIGKKVGDEVDVNVTFPAEYQAAELAGKAVTFKVKIHTIYTEVEPDLTDEWISKNTGLDTVAEFRADIERRLRNQVSEQNRSNIKNLVMEEILKNSKVKAFPKSLIDEYVSSIEEYYTNVAKTYNLTLEEFITQQMAMKVKDFYSDCEGLAKNNAATKMTLELIGKELGLQLKEEIYQEGLKKYAEINNYESTEALEKAAGKGKLQNIIYDDMVYDAILEHVNIKPEQ